MTVLFAGCSLTQGIGLTNEKTDENLFCNILVENVPILQNHQVLNDAHGGFSNEEIFLSAARRLMTADLDFLFVCWTSFPRYVFYPSTRTLSEKILINPHFKEDRYKNFSTDLLLISTEYSHFRNIVLYTNILENLAVLKGARIFFINNFLNVGNIEKLLGELDIDVEPAHSLFVNCLRVGGETEELENVKNNLRAQGKISMANWLTPTCSFLNFFIDRGNDGRHPGPDSHKAFAKFLIDQLNLKL